MKGFVLDRVGIVFCSLSLLVVSWAVFDTPSFLRVLSYNRRSSFTGRELRIIRIPGAIVLLGLTALLMATLLGRGV